MKRYRSCAKLFSIATGCLLTAFGLSAFAAEKDAVKPKPVKHLILPGEAFLVEGRPAFVMWPEPEKRRKPQPWVLYSPTLPGLPDRAEKWMHQQLLQAGIAVAGIDVGEGHGSPKSQQLFTALYEHLTRERGLAKKPCLLGRSRGGLWSSSWALRNTDKLAGLAGIYPVYDLRSYPKLKRAAPAYGLTEAELTQRLEEHNPIAQINRLAEADIPVFIIHGDQDRVVPLKENSQSLLDAYKKAGNAASVQLVVAKGQGHNFWPGFFHCGDLVDFMIQRARAGASMKPAKLKRQHPISAVAYKDIPFKQADDVSLLLDLYRPREAAGPVPIVMWVHGGGWKNGSKDRCPAIWLVEHGYAVASINYRLTQQAQWPAQIDDCRDAVRFLRANAKQYDLDGSHIAAWGGSAGGHLVAVLGASTPPATEKVSSRVQAVCDWFGPADLLTMPPNTLGNGRTLKDIANSNGAKLLGGTVRDLPELAKQASALYQVSKDDPPFLIMHGGADPGVPVTQSKRLYAKLLEAGVPSTLHIIPGAGHGGKAFESDDSRKRILEFFERHLKP